MIKTEHLFDLTLRLGTLLSVGTTSIGERRVAGINGGTLVGSKLNGEILSGSDCQLLRSDGVLEIDAMYVVQLAQGEHVRIINQGYRHGPAEVLERLARGEAVSADAYFFRTVMRFETGAPSFAWLNKTIAIAQAERQSDSVIFRSFQLL
ncbi:DUF3237 family protein [Undibacterium sp. SXout7W]|uniref:DUF3237 family protein n=1 Tax=Undibacterium sp. SXout7W TaxID=3413049 RepID=UPI003BF36437